MTGEPFIPQTITVHLGRPDSNAENVVIDFPDYIKNVASSEIFPTWPDSSLRANIYVIVTYALNRIYTEWYRSRGYNFDITSSTQYDQAFVQGRDIYEPVSRIVDELFNDYVRRPGSIEPYFTAFCNGTTVTCSGLSQWGTVDLANQGYVPFDILTYYYGDSLELVNNAPVHINSPSFEGTTLTLGMASNAVKTIQVQLNRISQNYPAIPKISSADSVFGKETEDAVRAFQGIFNLPQTGAVDKATWYKIAFIFVSVKRLAELRSEGVRLEEIQRQYSPEALRKGTSSDEIKVLQYYLSVIGAYYENVLPVDITGYFGDMTEASVVSFQRVFGLPPTGAVDARTWADLSRAYTGIVENVPPEGVTEGAALFPGIVLTEGMNNEYIRVMQEYLSFIHNSYPNIPAVNPTGFFGPQTKASVTAFQKQFGLTPNGIVGAVTWNEIAGVYSDLRFGFIKQPGQYPGYIIR